MLIFSIPASFSFLEMKGEPKERLHSCTNRILYTFILLPCMEIMYGSYLACFTVGCSELILSCLSRVLISITGMVGQSLSLSLSLSLTHTHTHTHTHTNMTDFCVMHFMRCIAVYILYFLNPYRYNDCWFLSWLGAQSYISRWGRCQVNFLDNSFHHHL